VLTFLLSVIGGIEASIVSFSRTAFANARDGRLPPQFGRPHRESRTPVFAVLAGAAIVLALLLVSAAFDTVDEAITASINATGIIVAAYYAMAALACAVFFRRKRESRPRTIAVYVVWPLASAVIFLGAALLTITAMEPLALGVLLGCLLLGVCVFFAHPRLASLP
jgi:amino acid transporter